MSQATRVNITPRTTASELLIAVNRLQISLMIRDPFVARAFRAAEDDGLAPDLVMVDQPRTLDGGAAERVLEMAEGRAMNLTQPTKHFDTLAEAEDTLKHQGFKLVPDTCNWIDEAGLIDAGVYAVEGAYGVLKFRIEYWTLKGKVTERRAAEDYAQCMRELVDVHYPDAECIRVVQDNLSIHSAGALYQAFEPTEARRILRRLEFHYTPKHASWLNMVEIEIGVLRGQCLDRRIDDPNRLVTEIGEWQRQRNAAGARIKWMFTTEKARAKMGRAYPNAAKES